MQFLQMDLTKFEVYKPEFKPDGEGDVDAVYNKPFMFEICGNIQPVSENSSPEAYGIDVKRGYAIYMPVCMEIQKLDRLFDGHCWYEVKAVRRFRSYCRVLVEEVKDNGQRY